MNEDRTARLRELALLFLKLGVIGFGGPAAHIALMEDEVVRRRAWLSREDFLDLIGATNLIPGPNSTEMAIHIGRIRAGTWGLIVAGTCFILPAMFLVMGCAWLYSTYGTLPQAAVLLYGVKPVIIAVVLQALWGLARSALKNATLMAIAIGVSIGSLLGGHELLLLFGGAMAALLARNWTSRQRGGAALAGMFSLTQAKSLAQAAAPAGAVSLAALPSSAAATVGLWPLFLFFLKVGSVLFGSGYVLLAFLRADLVERWHWLTEAQLLDAIAIGQITPGPVFTTATFVGFLLGGVPGAFVSTLGIFLPAFVFVAMSAPFLAKLRASTTASALLDGLNAASLALMAVVTLYLGKSALVDGWTVAVALAAAVLLIRFRVNSAWLVLAGGAMGFLITKT
jgi:chromate transporter